MRPVWWAWTGSLVVLPSLTGCLPLSAAVVAPVMATASPFAAAPPGPTMPPTSSTPTTPGPASPTPMGSTTSRPESAVIAPTGGGLTWRAAGRLVDGRRAVELGLTADHRVGLMWMNPELLTFRYIPGYRFPEGGPSRPVDNQPSTWTRRLVAAFNGAFELKDGAGGYWYAGRTVRPLRRGLATLTVSRAGRLAVSAWGGQTTPDPGTEVVRQNLTPVVSHGRSMAGSPDGRALWGNANGGLSTANRTALGQLADGSLVFAYGSEVTVTELADALVRAGVRTAMVLDMNKSWPMGFVYSAAHPGGLPPGERIQSGIWRDPSTYYSRFEKDFVVALTPSRNAVGPAVP